jgi:hypothetical protein
MPSTKSALVMMSICVLYNIQQSLVPEQGGALAVASGVRRTRHAQLRLCSHPAGLAGGASFTHRVCLMTFKHNRRNPQHVLHQCEGMMSKAHLSIR